MSNGTEAQSYEVIARSEGPDDETVEQHYQEVKEKYGQYLADDEHAWWQVCNRLGIDCSSPAEREGGGGEVKEIQLADLELVTDTMNVQFGGLVTDVTEIEEGEYDDNDAYLRYTLVDDTGRHRVQAKKPEVMAKLRDKGVQVGDFLDLDGAFAFHWEHGEREGVSVHITEYTDWEIEEDVDVFEVLPGASDEPLTDGQPCAVRGLCLGGDKVNWTQCSECRQKVEDDDGCACHEPHPDNFRERENTVIQVSDGEGVHEFFIDGHQDIDGQEVTVIGERNDDRDEIRVLQWEAVPDDAAPPKEELKKEKARESITRTLKSFERMPRAVIEKKAREDHPDTDEEALIDALVDEELVEEREDELIWTGK